MRPANNQKNRNTTDNSKAKQIPGNNLKRNFKRHQLYGKIFFFSFLVSYYFREKKTQNVLNQTKPEQGGRNMLDSSNYLCNLRKNPFRINKKV